MTAKITDLTYPEEADYMDWIKISFAILNDSDQPHYIWYRVVDRDTGEEVVPKEESYWLPHETKEATKVVMMPNRDWHLRLETGRWDTTDDTRDFTIKLSTAPPPGEGSIEVLVYDEDTEEPIYHAYVKIRELDRVQYTDENGRTIFTGVPYGTYTVFVSAFGYWEREEKEVSISPAEPTITVKFYLKKEAPTVATLYGYVTDAKTSEPIAEAEVILTSALKGTTDANGYYEITGIYPAGTYTVTCIKEGYKTFTQEVEIHEGEKKRLDIRLEPRTPLTGTVWGYTYCIKEGKKYTLPSVKVELISATTGKKVKETTSGGDGRYELSDIPWDTYTLRATKDYYEEFRVTVYVTREEPIRVDCELTIDTTKAGRIQAYAFDTTTMIPIAEAEVKISDTVEDHGKTEANGTFISSPLPPGTYTVVVTKTGYNAYTTTATVKSGETTKIDAPMTPGAPPTPPTPPEKTGTLEGHVYDFDTRKPVMDAIISCADKSARTNAVGYYRIEGLKAGMYEVVCTAEGYRTAKATVKIEAGKTAIYDFYLEPLEVKPGWQKWLEENWPYIALGAGVVSMATTAGFVAYHVAKGAGKE